MATDRELAARSMMQAGIGSLSGRPSRPQYESVGDEMRGEGSLETMSGKKIFPTQMNDWGLEDEDNQAVSIGERESRDVDWGGLPVGGPVDSPRDHLWWQYPTGYQGKTGAYVYGNRGGAVGLEPGIASLMGYAKGGMVTKVKVPKGQSKWMKRFVNNMRDN